MLGTELMETLIKSSALASCEERLNLSWCCHSDPEPGESCWSCSTAGLLDCTGGLVKAQWSRKLGLAGNLLDGFCAPVKDPAAPAFPVPGILGSGASLGNSLLWEGRAHRGASFS